MASWRMVPPAMEYQQALNAAFKDPKRLKELTEDEWERMKKDWLAAKAASRKSPKSTT